MHADYALVLLKADNAIDLGLGALRGGTGRKELMLTIERLDFEFRKAP
jgi:hypothetical protein